MSNSFIRCTHTGFHQNGTINSAPVYINDLDGGQEFQSRKTACYVPVGKSIDIPMTSRSMFSYDRGTIRKFVQAGVLIATLYDQPIPTTQTVWYLDNINGNDGNTGLTQSQALKTLAEFDKRIAGGLSKDTSLYLCSDLTLPEEYGELNLDLTTPTAVLRIFGHSTTTLKTGTITGTAAVNPATPQPQEIWDSSINWGTAGPGGTSLINERIKLTSGANAGACGWGLKILGDTTKMRTCPFVSFPYTDLMLPMVQSYISPGNVNYVVERLPLITGSLKFNIQRSCAASTHAAIISNFGVAIIGVDINAKTVTVTGTEVVYWMHSRVRVGQYDAAIPAFGDCLLTAPSSGAITLLRQTSSFSNIILNGGGAKSPLSISGNTFIAQHFIAQGCYLSLTAGRTYTFSTGFCVFDSTTFGINVSSNAKLELTYNAYLWGNGNTGVGIDVPAGNQVTYSTRKPSITGTGGDTKVGGAVKAYATIPFADTTKLCAISLA